ncbi:MAG: hypothetical protein AAFP97_09160 [Pseudomonadota bacterium]
MAEKKSERLEVRLGYSEKEAFVEACDTQGDTPSGAVRRFIAGYTRRSDSDLMEEANRRILRRYALAAGLATVSVIAIIAFVMSPAYLRTIPSDETLFALRDLNQDGELSVDEYGLPPERDGSPNGVLRVLDLDGSGTLSSEEFVAKGRRVYRLHDGEGVLPSADEGVAALSFVEFEFGEDRVESGTFHNATINAGELDRLVIWYPDGTNAVFEDDIRIESDGELRIWSERVTFPASVSVETTDEAAIARRE